MRSETLEAMFGVIIVMNLRCYRISIFKAALDSIICAEIQCYVQ